MEEKNAKKKILYVLSSVIFILIPLIGAALFCLKDGKTIFDTFFPYSGWSDEITYYKQIEAAIESGIPQGYFGYNESRAELLSFGAWGPFPLIPYIIWGKIFGWTYLAPVFANITMCSIAFLMLVLLAKPDIKQMAAIGLFWMLSPSMNRYVLSGTAEPVYIAAMIIFTAACIRMCSRNGKWKASPVISTIVAFYLTLCRGYFAVLFLIPFVIGVVKKKKAILLTEAICLICSFAGFLVIRKYFCAEYYGGVYKTGLSFASLMENIKNNFADSAKLSWYALRYHSGIDAWGLLIFYVSLMCMIPSCVLLIKKNKHLAAISFSMLFCEIVIVVAFFAIYGINEFGRHMLCFVLANIMLVTTEKHWYLSCPLILLIICQIFLMWGDIKGVYKTDEAEEKLDSLETAMAEKMTLTDEMSYANLLAMPTSEHDAEGNAVIEPYYGYMFAAPAGFAVSLDNEDFYDDVSNIVAGYVLCSPYGTIRTRLEEAGFECIIEDDDLVVLKSPLYGSN